MLVGKEGRGRLQSPQQEDSAAFDCGTDKSPGPDGFTFGFYRRFWKVIEDDVVNDVTYLFTHGFFPKGSNSSFIALISKVPNANMVKDFRPISLIGSLYKIIAKILANRLVVVLGDIVNKVQSAFVADRQILDDPFILNEVFQWCKSKKKQSLIFKVDFEKAYDSVRWDFLDDVLKKFGFGDKWCNWIQSCLRSSRGSIIVNGSPTEEFQFYKGLKQGDPLSPFLFILIMESLHISFQRVVDAGMFKGITLSSSLQLSHMFYADDVVFVGQWSDANFDTIVHVLECFFRASGLRINMSKSKLMGISVEKDKVERAASKIGCLILKPPFSYLGSKVGGLMSRVQSWNEVVDRVIARLSKWKMKTLSVGGRLKCIRNHFFSGHDLNSKKTSWVKWKNVLASKEKEGLGVSSLYALNRGLMFKWVWRFFTQNTSLWTRVIKTIHGEDGKVGKNVKSGFPSIWLDIVHEMDVLKKQDIDIINCRFGPIGEIGILSLVASVRKLIDDKMLPKVATKTRWIKFVPIKVNVLAWKVRLDSLPTRLNISRRGMDIDSITCPICDNGVESTSHLFFTCHIASEISRKISSWWDVSYMEISSYEDWLTWIVNLRLPIKHK
ncbi:RNA-directed DNA polymerase, eukaryota [Tanacetum coccineum]